MFIPRNDVVVVREEKNNEISSAVDGEGTKNKNDNLITHH